MKKDKDLKGIYFEMRVGGENPKNFGFLLNVLNRFDNLRDYNIVKMEVEDNEDPDKKNLKIILEENETVN